MKKIYLSFLLIITTANIFAGKISDKYFIGAGASLSTINMNREPEGHARRGMNFKAGIKFSPVFRITSEYTNQFAYSIEPAWKLIHSQSYELSANLLANLVDANASFYTITGLSFQHWRGHFTGVDHYFQLVDLGRTPKDFSTNWGSVIVGCGFEKIIDRFSFFAEFKYRISKKQENVPLNIIDACYTTGLKYSFNNSHSSKDKLPHKRHFFRIPNDKYHWF